MKGMHVREAFDASKIPVEWMVRVVIISESVKWESALVSISTLCKSSWDLFERQDELRSTVGGATRWHERDRATLELSELPALWIVSSIVLFEMRQWSDSISNSKWFILLWEVMMRSCGPTGYHAVMRNGAVREAIDASKVLEPLCEWNKFFLQNVCQRERI